MGLLFRQRHERDLIWESMSKMEWNIRIVFGCSLRDVREPSTVFMHAFHSRFLPSAPTPALLSDGFDLEVEAEINRVFSKLLLARVSVQQNETRTACLSLGLSTDVQGQAWLQMLVTPVLWVVETGRSLVPCQGTEVDSDRAEHPTSSPCFHMCSSAHYHTCTLDSQTYERDVCLGLTAL